VSDPAADASIVLEELRPGRRLKVRLNEPVHGQKPWPDNGAGD
jgi:hypothetical protein